MREKLVVSPYVLKYIHLFLLQKKEASKSECIWMELKGEKYNSDIMVGIYYRPSSQEVDEALFKVINYPKF